MTLIACQLPPLQRLFRISLSEIHQSNIVLGERITGFGGRITYDPSRPDGAPRKLLDVSRLTALGWRSSIGLEDGVRDTYAWFTNHRATAEPGK